ncbi:LON peptidase substrate-binding domain-containing protein [Photobacterium sp. SDRW27]|uniref:LON peptidase substrate-binding domain-containing protein n=1 Tax=Photobacterium obscurum TaxID=2829490 RepID=UPI0022439931|nr:LON peptidase substrate-binding domain-containing protein [Photobacterium obscurum]MCW8330800.1 LON peptidase substrate-binding domain-containing protein [Photobacterium obscurum]
MSGMALFPSSHHLLPGGRLEVTIAEEKYLRMIKQSLKAERSFALCMLNEGEEHDEIKKIPAIATEAEVIDFNNAGNGLLSVILEGKQKVRLIAIRIEEDGLLYADYLLYPNWLTEPIDESTLCLAEKLKLFYATMPEIGSLYPTPSYDDITWVSQRWVEILPLEVQYKQLLITQESIKLTVRFLLKLLDNDELPIPELV